MKRKYSTIKYKIAGKCYFKLIGLLVLLAGFSSCKKWIEVPAPVNNLNAANVYNNNASAAAVLTGIYTNMSNGNTDFEVTFTGGFSNTSLSLQLGLSADELGLFDNGNTTLNLYYTNSLTSSIIDKNDFWINIYKIVFTTNAAIEGLQGSTGLTPAVKNQLLGEAKFMRAFCYFYLVNLYGDVPLVLGTDPLANSVLPRVPTSQVYQQIIADLKDAQNLLSDHYLDATVLGSTVERVRPTKWAATALLARAYLYNKDYTDAATQATGVISSGNYSLTDLNSVFLKSSNEAIWQLQPVGLDALSTANTGEGRLFVMPDGPNTNLFGGYHPVYLNSNLVNSFETGDARKANWTASVTVGGTTYYYAYKYKEGAVPSATKEYMMIFRLGEQYLIRAEAKAQNGDVAGAQADLNAIRKRAGLPNTTAGDKPSLLKAILHERQVELFTELGQRWLDLKRTGNIDVVMSASKGTAWTTNQQLYPVPLTDMLKDPNLVQNPGY